MGLYFQPKTQVNRSSYSCSDTETSQGPCDDCSIVFFLMLPAAYLIDVRLAVYIPLLMPIAMKIAAKKDIKKI
jgi:hypothetical protein